MFDIPKIKHEVEHRSDITLVSRLTSIRGPFPEWFFHRSSNSMEISFSVTPLYGITPLQTFAHATAAQLSCHMQTFMKRLFYDSLHDIRMKFPSNLNYDGKMFRETGPWSTDGSLEWMESWMHNWQLPENKMPITSITDRQTCDRCAKPFCWCQLLTRLFDGWVMVA